MDDHKRELEAKLARCRRLASQFQDGVTTRHLQELAAELEQQIRAIEK